jgi:hypothetical protein
VSIRQQPTNNSPVAGADDRCTIRSSGSSDCGVLPRRIRLEDLPILPVDDSAVANSAAAPAVDAVLDVDETRRALPLLPSRLVRIKRCAVTTPTDSPLAAISWRSRDKLAPICDAINKTRTKEQHCQQHINQLKTHRSFACQLRIGGAASSVDERFWRG